MEQQYQTLSEREQKEFTAKLMHAIQQFPHAFMMAQAIIDLAEKFRVYEKVKFNRNEKNN